MPYQQWGQGVALLLTDMIEPGAVTYEDGREAAARGAKVTCVPLGDFRGFKSD